MDTQAEQARMILRQYDFYIIRGLLLSMTVVLLCIVVLMCLFGFVDEARGSGETRSFATIALVVVLRIPLQLGEMVPYITFLGAVIGFGVLSASSEVTVLRVAGVSQWRLAVSASIAALAFLGVMSLVTEFLGPTSTEHANSLEDPEAKSKPSRGYWYREGNVFTWLRDVDETGHLTEVKQFEFDGIGNLVRATAAQKGTPAARSGSWSLGNVSETLIDPAGKYTRTSNQRDWKLHSDFSSFATRVKREPEDLSLVDMHSHIQYLKGEGMETGQFEITFWSRLTTPFMVVGLVLIAIGFVLGPLRETGMGTRITAGIGAGVFFGYLQQTLGPMALLYDAPPLLAVCLPLIVMWGVGLFLLRRLT